MNLPVEIFFKIESYCDIFTRQVFLMLNKRIRFIFLQKYTGYILYSESSSLVYDTYKITIHKNKRCLHDYIKKNNEKMHVILKKVRFTHLGRYIVEEHNSMRIFDETAYICKYISNY